MSVLLVTQDFPPDCGGIQTYCWELSRHLLTRGHAVRVLCPTPEWRAGLAPAERDLPAGLAVDRIAVLGSFLFAPLAVWIRGYLRAHPEIRTIIYAQWQSALWQLGAAELVGRYRRLCLVHGRELLKTVCGPFTRSLATRVLAGMDQVLPVSNRVRDLVGQLPLPGPVQVRVVPPGVDPNRFQPLDAQPLRGRLQIADGVPVVLSLSRLAARKNLDGLLRAFARVRAELPAAILLIGGDGPERAPLEAQAGAAGLTGSVRFLGKVPAGELVAHYNLADVFVLPSRDHPRDVEGFGITLLEAGACQRPVVAGRAGGMVDAVVDGETGLLVDSTDDNALTAGLLRLLTDPRSAQRMGVAARARILRELTWERCAERIEQGLASAAPPAAVASAASAHP